MELFKLRLFWAKIFVILIMFIQNGISIAQNKMNQSVFSFGVGASFLNLEGKNIPLFDNNGSNSAGNSFKSSPVYLINYDFGLKDRYSLGLSGSYQFFASRYDYEFYVNNNNLYPYYNPGSTQFQTDKFERFNFGIRLLSHLSKNDKRDLYAGLRIGYSYWTASTDNTDTNYEIKEKKHYRPSAISNILDEKYPPVTGQILFGIRYYIVQNFGINAELSAGGPNFIMTGLNLRF